MTQDKGLPKGWRIVRFGDVVRSVKINVDAEKSGLERYVAGGHMETDNLHIRSWGTVGDGYLGPAFHRKFVKGQVLYGSRRTYLRKVAVAEFDGVCANTTFVLEPKDDDLIPELLPFIMQTEAYTQHSIKQSKGSTNPYVNWKDLAWYEFPLPPLNEQRRIADILWAVDDSLEKISATREAAKRLRDSLIENFITQGPPRRYTEYKTTPIGRLPRSWSYVSCSHLFAEKPHNGLSPKTNVEGRGYPTLSISAIRNGKVIVEGNLKYAEISTEDAERYKLCPRDLLVVRGNGNRDLVGICGMVEDVPDGCFYPDLLIRVKFDPSKLRSGFACMQWNTPFIHRKLVAMAQSTSGIWKINSKHLQEHKLIVPPLEDQDALLELSKPHAETMMRLTKHLALTQELKRRLIDTLLGSDRT